MVYYGEFINKEEGDLVKRLFEEENPRLLDCVEDYNNHNNYLNLKNSIYDFLNSLPEYQSQKPKAPKTIGEAIE
jgi:hypothetical protein